MKALRPALILTVLPGVAAGSLRAAEIAAAAPAPPPAAAKASTSLPMQPLFTRVHERTEALFQHRNGPPPRPDPRFNPFRTPGTVPPVAAPAADGEAGVKLPIGAEPGAHGPAPGVSLTLLQQGAATLKVSGIFEIAGRAHLVINSRPYKEGDVVQTLVQGETVYLRIKEIARRSVTLSLNDAEMTLKY